MDNTRPQVRFMFEPSHVARKRHIQVAFADTTEVFERNHIPRDGMPVEECNMWFLRYLSFTLTGHKAAGGFRYSGANRRDTQVPRVLPYN